MKNAKIIVKDQGLSVNQFLATVLAERVGEMKAMAVLRHRASIGAPDRALAILKRAPDIAPMVGDEV